MRFFSVFIFNINEWQSDAEFATNPNNGLKAHLPPERFDQLSRKVQAKPGA